MQMVASVHPFTQLVSVMRYRLVGRAQSQFLFCAVQEVPAQNLCRSIFGSLSNLELLPSEKVSIVRDSLM